MLIKVWITMCISFVQMIGIPYMHNIQKYSHVVAIERTLREKSM